MFGIFDDSLPGTKEPPRPAWYRESLEAYPELEYDDEDIYGDPIPNRMTVMVQHWSIGAFARSWEACQNKKTGYFNAGPPMDDPRCPVCEDEYQIKGNLYRHIQMNHPWYDLYGDDLGLHGWLERRGLKAKTIKNHCRLRQMLLDVGYGGGIS